MQHGGPRLRVALAVAALALVAGCGPAGSTAGNTAGSTAGSTGSPPATPSAGAGQTTTAAAAFRLRPVIQGPEPVTGSVEGPPVPAAPTTAPSGSAQSSPPVTREQAAAVYAGFSCGPDRGAGADGPQDYVVACDVDGRQKYLLGPAVAQNGDVASAQAATRQGSAEWVVLIDFTPAARTAFADYTAHHIGEAVALSVDGRVISAPVIQGAITGQLAVSAHFTQDSAERLAKQLSG